MSKNNKKVTKTVVASAIVASALAPVASAAGVQFSDTDKHWAKTAISDLAREGIIAGYTDGTFKPEKEMTRLEFASLLAKALEKEGALPKASGETKFKDVPNWAKGSIHDLNKKGIVFGYSETEFGANDKITRQQMAVMIVRAMGYEAKAAQLDLPIPFNDKDAIGSSYKSAIAFAAKIGLVKGDGKGNFNPTAPAKRGEAASFVHRLHTGDMSESGDFKEDAEKLVAEHADLTFDNKGIVLTEKLASYKITGTTKPGTKLNVIVTDTSDDAGTEADETKKVESLNVVANNKGKFETTLDLTTLKDGDLTITAVALDAEGNATEEKTTTKVVKDTVAPTAVSVLLQTAEINRLTNQADYRVMGTTEPGAKVKVVLTQGELVLTKEATADAIMGEYTVSFDTNDLIIGNFTVKATASDAAGNSVDSLVKTGTKDTSAEVTPQVVTVEHVDAANTEEKVTISGYGTPGKKMIIEYSGKKAPTSGVSAAADTLTKKIEVTPDANGVWTAELELKEFAEGEVSVVVVDGNKRSKLTTVVKDLVAPETPVVTTKGYINAKNEKEFTVSGTAEANSKVALILIDKENKETTKVEVAADKDGKFTAKVDASELADGKVKVKATATDKAGNTSVVAATLPELEKDVVAPSGTILDALAEIKKETKLDEYTVSGKTEVGASVVVELSNKADNDGDVIKVTSDKVDVKEDGTFSVKVNPTILSDGEIDVKVTVTDKAGNAEEKTTTVVKKVGALDVIVKLHAEGKTAELTLKQLVDADVENTVEANLTGYQAALAKLTKVETLADVQTVVDEVNAVTNYKGNVTVEKVEKGFKVTYGTALTATDKTVLGSYDADAVLTLDRVLEDGETVTISGLAATPITLSKEEVKGKEINLSAIKGSAGKASEQKGSFTVTVTSETLDSDINVTAEAVLVKGTETVLTGKKESLTIKAVTLAETKAIDAYKNFVDVTATENAFTVTYGGTTLTDADKTILANYDADAVLTLSRALEPGESVTIEGLKATPITLDSTKVTGTEINLSGIKGSAGKASEQKGSFTVTVTNEALDSDLTVTAEAVLVKGGKTTKTGKEAELVIKSAKAESIDNYKKNVTVETIEKGFKVTYGTALTEADKTILTNYNADAVLTLDRALTDDETVVLTLKEGTVEVKGSDLEGKVINLSQVLKTPAAKASEQEGSFTVEVTSETLNSPLNVTAKAILVKGTSKVDASEEKTLTIQSAKAEALAKETAAIDAYKNFVDVTATVDSIKVTYGGSTLTDDDKEVLVNYNADAVLTLSRALEPGETVTIEGLTTAPITLSKTEVTGTEIKLSGIKGSAGKASNQTGSFTVKVTNENLDSDVTVTAEAVLVKGGKTTKTGKEAELVIKSAKAAALAKENAAIENYKNNVTVEKVEKGFKVTYGTALSDADKAVLANYNADAVLTLSRPLTATETVTLTLKEGPITVNGSDLEGKVINLSEVLGVTGAKASEQEGAFTVEVTSEALDNDVTITAEAVLVKDDKTIKTGKEETVEIKSTKAAALASYKEYVNVTLDGKKVNVTYGDAGKTLSDADKAVLDTYKADAQLTLNRPLAPGETVSLKLKNGTVLPVDPTKIVDGKVLLSEAIGIPATKASTQSNPFEAEVVSTNLTNDLTVTAEAVLLKDDVVAYETGKKVDVNLLSNEGIVFANYANYVDVEFLTATNTFFVDYGANYTLTTEDKALLDNYKADALLTFSRDFEEGESVTLKLKNDAVFLIDPSKIVEGKALLSELIGIPATKASTQNASFTIEIVNPTVKEEAITVTAEAVLTKEGIDPIKTGKKETYTANPNN